MVMIILVKNMAIAFCMREKYTKQPLHLQGLSGITMIFLTILNQYKKTKKWWR